MARLRKRGDTWYAIYYDRNGRRLFKSTLCSDKRAAETVARRLERQAQDPDHAAKNETSLSMILESLIDDRVEQATAGKRSHETVKMYRAKAGHLKRVFEIDANGEHLPFRVAALSARHVDTYISKRRTEGAAENTIAKELVTLRAALKLAKRRGQWHGDTATVMPIAFAPEYKPKRRFLSREEFPLLLAQLTPDHAARAAFQVATSANLGETFRAQRCDVTASAVFIRGTKRTSRLRTVPIVSDEQQKLMNHALENAQGQDGKLFAYDAGYGDALDRACADAKIERCTSNDLRRTFTHWMRSRGLPAELVAPAMGHADTRMIERIYGKLTTEELATRMAQVIGTPVAQQNAEQAHSAHHSDDDESRKSLKMVPRAGLEPARPFGQGILSPLGEPPRPREYKRKRDYSGRDGTPVAQPATAGGIVITMPKRRGGAP